MARIWLVPVAGIALASLLAAGCSSSTRGSATTPPGSASSGGSSGDNSTLSPDNLVADVFDALDSAQNFHVAGDGADQGTRYTFDVHFGSGGGSGYLTQGDERFDLAGSSGHIYVKASAASWKATIGKDKPDVDAKAKVLAAHWVLVPDDADFAQLADYVDKSQFVKSFRSSAATDSGPFEKTGTAEVNGTRAVLFTDKHNDSKIYVAAQGAPLLLKVDHAASEGGGGITFDQYNQPFTPKLPAADQVVDYTKIVT